MREGCDTSYVAEVLLALRDVLVEILVKASDESEESSDEDIESDDEDLQPEPLKESNNTAADNSNCKCSPPSYHQHFCTLCSHLIY